VVYWESAAPVPVSKLSRGQAFHLVSPAGLRFPGTVIAKSKFELVAVRLESNPECLLYWDAETKVVPLKFTRDIGEWMVARHGAIEENTKMAEAKTAALPIGKTKLAQKLAAKGQAAAGTTAAPAEAKAPKQPKPLNACGCGCGEQVSGQFRQGHDSKFYSMLRKVCRGEMAFNSLPPQVQKTVGTVEAARKLLASHGWKVEPPKPKAPKAAKAPKTTAQGAQAAQPLPPSPPSPAEEAKEAEGEEEETPIHDATQ